MQPTPVDFSCCPGKFYTDTDILFRYLFRFIHGAGLRYQEDNSGENALVSYCEKFIPSSQPAAYDIGPNFDMNMSMLSWFENPEILELEVTRTDVNSEKVYKDRRKVQKYYRKHNEDYLKAFKPLY